MKLRELFDKIDEMIKQPGAESTGSNDPKANKDIKPLDKDDDRAEYTDKADGLSKVQNNTGGGK